jgi:hypothetical protein
MSKAPVYLLDNLKRTTMFNIKKGFLMGHNFKSRSIRIIETEEGPMFKIILANVEKPLILGEKNMLTLKNKKTDDIVDISLGEFYNSPMYFSNDYCFYGTDSKADMYEEPVPMDPYLLGLWLGKGVSDKSIIKIIEPEIGAWLIDYADRNAMEISNKTYKKVKSYYISNKNQKDGEEIVFVKHLHDMGIANNKHIPEVYFKNSKGIRLSLLAALIDANGFKKDNVYYTIIIKEENLKNDIIFLSRSLGFNVTWTKSKKYNSYNIQIHGELISQIPCKLDKKRIINPKKAESMKFNIKTITKIEDGVYDTVSIYGKDGRYLTEDFVVMRRDYVPEPNNFSLSEEDDQLQSEEELEEKYEMPSKRHLSDYQPSSIQDLEGLFPSIGVYSDDTWLMRFGSR